MTGAYTIKKLWQNPKLLRNDFPMAGKWNMPIIRRCDVDLEKILLIGSDKIRTNDSSTNIFKTVHFFVDDNKLDKYFNEPERYLPRLAQYPHTLTPDYSLYTDMPMAI